MSLLCMGLFLIYRFDESRTPHIGGIENVRFFDRTAPGSAMVAGDDSLAGEKADRFGSAPSSRKNTPQCP